jgi:hypothetical protein
MHGCYTILREEGLRGLYKGYVIYNECLVSQTLASLTASLLREGTYSTLRMGLYDVLKDVLHAENPRTYTNDVYIYGANARTRHHAVVEEDRGRGYSRGTGQRHCQSD